MKKFVLVVFGVFLVILAAAYFSNPIVPAYAKGKLTKKMIVKAKLKAGLELGKAEFYSAKLGSNGLSCAKCHVDSIGTYMPKIGKVIRSLAGAAATFPRYNPKNHNIVTLGEQDNKCIMGNMDGKPLSGQKRNYLTLYVTHLSNGYAYRIKSKIPQKVLARGKYYYDTPLGASDYSCNSCHPGGGAGILGGKPTKPVIGHAVLYPSYKKWGGIITMQDQFNHCIYTGETGLKKKIDSKAWKYLDLYIYSMSRGYKIKVIK